MHLFSCFLKGEKKICLLNFFNVRNKTNMPWSNHLENSSYYIFLLYIVGSETPFHKKLYLTLICQILLEWSPAFPPYNTCYHPLDKSVKSTGSRLEFWNLLTSGCGLGNSACAPSCSFLICGYVCTHSSKVIIISNREGMSKQFRKDEKLVSQRVKEIWRDPEESTRLARHIGYLELLLKLMFVNPKKVKELKAKGIQQKLVK